MLNFDNLNRNNIQHTIRLFLEEDNYLNLNKKNIY